MSFKLSDFSKYHYVLNFDKEDIAEKTESKILDFGWDWAELINYCFEINSLV